MSKYIISGIGPSQGGVGRLVSELIEYAKEKHPEINVITIYGKKNRFYKILKESFLGDLLKLIFYKYLMQKGIKSKIENINHSQVLVIHPQTLGFDNFYTLFSKGNRVNLYVTDNSFFCLKSYNHISNELHPCLKCLNGNRFEEAEINGCETFPVNYSNKENVVFLQFLKSNYLQINFLAQNSNQVDMLKKHFGKNCNVDVVGMFTNEIIWSDNLTEIKTIDIVYHGSIDEAKGILYMIELAKYLKEYKIIIPYDLSLVKSRYKAVQYYPENIIFKEMTWEDGLREAVISARVVINPSVWSAPVEGALLKSIGFNGCVAGFNGKYSLSEELLQLKLLIELNEDLEKSSGRIIEILNEEILRNAYVIKSRKWLNEYMSKKDKMQKMMFDCVFGDH